MSRTTVEPLHLVARPNTTSLIVSSDDYPNSSVAILPEDIRALRMIWILMQMSDQGRYPLFRGNRKPPEEAQKIHYGILVALLHFIIPEHVTSFLMEQLAKGVSVSQNIPPTQIAHIPRSLSVRFSLDPYRTVTTASSFFDYHADRLPCLLNASLNADLKTVKRICGKTHPDTLRRLLSTEGIAATCLGRVTVERIGTPLQMAIYVDNDDMGGYL